MLPPLSDPEVVLLPRGGVPAARPPGEAEEQSVVEAPAAWVLLHVRSGGFGAGLNPDRGVSNHPSKPGAFCLTNSTVIHFHLFSWLLLLLIYMFVCLFLIK